MVKKGEIYVKEAVIRTMTKDGIDYICITDIARQKNAVEPKDVVKNWMRQKNTLEYLGLWEKLNNPNFKGVEFNPLLSEAGSNSFTMSPRVVPVVVHLLNAILLSSLLIGSRSSLSFILLWSSNV